MRTQSEPAGDDRTGETGLDVAVPPPPPPPAPATPGPPSPQDGRGNRGRRNRGRRRGRHRAEPRWPSRGFLLVLGATLTAAGALGGAATVALSVPWLWPRLGAAALHHPDTVLATVMLAASLAAVWRMSGPRPPRGP